MDKFYATLKTIIIENDLLYKLGKIQCETSTNAIELNINAEKYVN